MDAGVAGGAQPDEPFRVVATGLPVMDVEAAREEAGLPCPAPAAVAIAIENRFPMAVEARPGARPSPVTGAAEPGEDGSSLPQVQNRLRWRTRVRFGLPGPRRGVQGESAGAEVIGVWPPEAKKRRAASERIRTRIWVSWHGCSLSALCRARIPEIVFSIKGRTVPTNSS
jgi:hypothetical protein